MKFYFLFPLWLVVGIILCWDTCSSERFMHQESKDVKKYGNYSGDIMLAAFFPVHAHDKDDNDGYVCGQIQEQDGIQPLEAFVHALDWINNKKDFLPNFTIGAIIADSCDDETHALEQAVDLIRVLMTRMNHPHDTPYVCSDGQTPELIPVLQDYHNVVGVVGGATSAVSIQLASLLKLFEVPQVSYLSTSPDLSVQERYPYFKRTVPSDSSQAQALIELLSLRGWTYVSVVYEDSNYGLKGYAELEKWAFAKDICLANSIRIEFDEPGWNDTYYDGIIDKLRTKDKAKVVVLFIDHPRALEFFKAAKRKGVKPGEFVWIGSDAWSARKSVVVGHEEIVEGAITMQPTAWQMPEFDRYFLGLKPYHPLRQFHNPWFNEFWEQHFQCLWVDVPPANNQSTDQQIELDICTGNETITQDNGYEQHQLLHFVQDAAIAFAYALKDLHVELCGEGYMGLCEAMAPANITGPKLLEKLTNVRFKSLIGQEFRFWNAVDGPPRYTMMSYMRDNSGGPRPSALPSWVEVGTASDIPGEKGVNFSESFLPVLQQYPTSLCSTPCELYQKRNFADACCWTCTNCSEWAAVLPVGDFVNSDDICVECGDGRQPNAYRNNCEVIKTTSMNYEHDYAIASLFLAMVGVILTALVTAVFLVHFHTPVIKASGREISLYLLASICISFLSTMIFVAPPSDVMCGFTRLFIGLSFTMVYASILTKTNRIARIFNENSNSPKKTRYTSPRSQLIIVNLVVSVEVFILLGWVITALPSTTHVYPTRPQNVMVCTDASDATYLIGLIYPMVLLILCTIYAFKTRKTPSGFNETRLIGFTSYTTCIIWLAFLSTFFITSDPFMRTAIIAICIQLNASVALICIFVPKVYICICRPNKNTREAIMARTSSIISSTDGSMFGYNFYGDSNEAMRNIRSVSMHTVGPIPPEIKNKKMSVSRMHKSASADAVGAIAEVAEEDMNYKTVFRNTPSVSLDLSKQNIETTITEPSLIRERASSSLSDSGNGSLTLSPVFLAALEGAMEEAKKNEANDEPTELQEIDNEVEDIDTQSDTIDTEEIDSIDEAFHDSLDVEPIDVDSIEVHITTEDETDT